MLLSENQFRGFLDVLKGLVNRYKGPLFHAKLLEYIIFLDKRIPLYPGIWQAILPKLFRNYDSREHTIRVGETVIISSENHDILGTIDKIGSDYYVLKNACLCQKYRKLSVSRDSRVTIISEEAIRDEWPTLFMQEDNDESL